MPKQDNALAAAEQEPTPNYYEFVGQPDMNPAGSYASAWAGEVSPGQVVEVRQQHLQHFEDNPEWRRSSKQAYNAQEKEQTDDE